MSILRTFIKQNIPETWILAYRREIRRKKSHPHKSKKSDQIFKEIHDGNYWSNSESVSGNGSDMISTGFLRVELENLLYNLKIDNVADIPCGDFNWMKRIDLSQFHYTGGDIVPALIDRNNELYHSKNVDFKFIDITESTLPKVDLILCRDCFVHLSFREIYKAIKNIKRSKSTYLLMTSFIDHQLNLDINTGDWRPLNFENAPFNFNPPEFTLIETKKYPHKALCLWKIEDIKISRFSFYIKSNFAYRLFLN